MIKFLVLIFTVWVKSDKRYGFLIKKKYLNYKVLNFALLLMISIHSSFASDPNANPYSISDQDLRSMQQDLAFASAPLMRSSVTAGAFSGGILLAGTQSLTGSGGGNNPSSGSASSNRGNSSRKRAIGSTKKKNQK